MEGRYLLPEPIQQRSGQADPYGLISRREPGALPGAATSSYGVPGRSPFPNATPLGQGEKQKAGSVYAGLV